MLNSKKHIVLSLLSVLSLTASARQNIYHKGWIDFNKNGKMDVYENPSAPIMERVSDLLAQMTTEEKTCQLATLYGSKRVLKGLGADGRVEKLCLEGRNCQYRRTGERHRPRRKRVFLSLQEKRRQQARHPKVVC